MGFVNIKDRFLCCKEQEEFFKKMQQTHPNLFECISYAAKEKAEKNQREVLVTLFKKVHGACPSECCRKDLDSFFLSEKFEVNTNTVASFYNTKDAIVDNIFIVAS